MDISLRVGDGRLVLGAADGAPTRFEHPDAPGHPFILDEATEDWHTAEHRWGSGFLAGPAGAGRWNHPVSLSVTPESVTAVHEVLPGLRLEAERRGGDVLTETYTLVNETAADVRIDAMGVQVPIRDIYPGSAESLRSACHAHVFTGGAWSWLLARPMSGRPPMLGLILREGELWAYSVESRNPGSGSNVRGHLVLQPTDHARNPAAFGGQPRITVPAGGTHRLSWEIGWYDEVPAFLAATRAPARLPRLAAELGEGLLVEGDAGVAAEDADAVPAEGGVELRGRRHGVVHVDIGKRSRTAVLFHLPARELVERRVAYILRHQRPLERPEPARHALVPVDTATGIRRLTSGWSDWSDGAERLGMAQLLQLARMRGWGDAAELDAALAGYAAFARAHLVDGTGAVRWGSDTVNVKPRLYNFPWTAQFFADRHVLTGDPADLELAARVLERAYELGAASHLSIGQAEAVVHVAGLLAAAGQAGRAASLRESLYGTARHFAAAGADLPAHEVNYEQSMVAPLVSTLAVVYGETREAALLPPLAEAVRWLLAFGGPQPHVRLRDIGIRHWDGFWFGQNRLYGDVFPHHWSALTAVALTQLPAELRTPETDGTAEAIFRANLANYREDGSATCAFVMPSTVDGAPAHREDPLANDQDWSLALWLRSRP
ncbi:hypothetical protein [Bailinhaonella thermotolerans]|uniref:hypothetical protein n=1 Tax=Bailinhaonella thermotolerans TaxID=1070861 RepID=UPI000E72790B|nr:hypothetical protein [Bailinhaonella thermotolerans]